MGTSILSIPWGIKQVKIWKTYGYENVFGNMARSSFFCSVIDTYRVVFFPLNRQDLLLESFSSYWWAFWHFIAVTELWNHEKWYVSFIMQIFPQNCEIQSSNSLSYACTLEYLYIKNKLCLNIKEWGSSCHLAIWELQFCCLICTTEGIYVFCSLCWIQFMHDCVIEGVSTLSVFLLFNTHNCCSFTYKLPPYLFK